MEIANISLRKHSSVFKLFRFLNKTKFFIITFSFLNINLFADLFLDKNKQVNNLGKTPGLIYSVGERINRPMSFQEDYK